MFFCTTWNSGQCNFSIHVGFPESRWQFWSQGKPRDDFLSRYKISINTSSKPFCLISAHMQTWLVCGPYSAVRGWEVSKSARLSWESLWGFVRAFWGLAEQQDVQSYTAIHGATASSSRNYLLPGCFPPSFHCYLSIRYQNLFSSGCCRTRCLVNSVVRNNETGIFNLEICFFF